MNSRFAVAMHTLTLLAMHEKDPVSSDLVAASVGTNPVVIRRLIGLLSAAGLVAVQSGRGGGAVLAREPKDVSLLDVYRAVEERDVIRLREGGNPDCPVGRELCSILEHYTEGAEQALAGYLNSKTLADVVGDMSKVMEA